MSRYRVIIWTGRLLTLIYTIAVLVDVLGDGTLSQEIRQVTITVVALVFAAIAIWQTRIAWKYEGLPVLPLPFRWVVVVFFASFALFCAWVIASSIWPEIYSDRRSSVLWWQFGTSTLWFASRWVTVDEPHPAGVGETGTGPGHGGGVS